MAPNPGMPRCPLTTTATGYPPTSRLLLPASDGYVPAPTAPLASDMWQPRQTLANNSSPLISKNLRPWLNPGDVEGAALCAQAMNDSSESAADIVMAKATQNFGLACIICTTPESGLRDIALVLASGFDHALVQPGDGVERRQDGALLPCR